MQNSNSKFKMSIVRKQNMHRNKATSLIIKQILIQHDIQKT